MAGGPTKSILRSAYSELLAPDIVTGAKRHFRAPITNWFAGPLMDEVRAELVYGERSLAELGIAIRLDELLSSIAREEPGAAETAYKLLTLIYWVQWIRERTSVGGIDG